MVPAVATVISTPDGDPAFTVERHAFHFAAMQQHEATSRCAAGCSVEAKNLKFPRARVVFARLQIAVKASDLRGIGRARRLREVEGVLELGMLVMAHGGACRQGAL